MPSRSVGFTGRIVFAAARCRAVEKPIKRRIIGSPHPRPSLWSRQPHGDGRHIVGNGPGRLRAGAAQLQSEFRGRAATVIRTNAQVELISQSISSVMAMSFNEMDEIANDYDFFDDIIRKLDAEVIFDRYNQF
jgi:hypothetical protein